MAKTPPKVFYKITYRDEEGTECAVTLYFQYTLAKTSNAFFRIQKVKERLKRVGYKRSGLDPSKIVRIEEVFKEETTYSGDLPADS